MAGIYTRDNFAQLLANAIENAQARRQAYVDREAQRTKENAGAIANFAKALGRTYETWGSDEEKLAALQKEREEAIKAQAMQEEKLAALQKEREEAIKAQAMQGYTPASSYVVPNYSEVLRKRGLYYEEKLAALQKEREEAIKAQAMQGYTPASSYVVPNYSEVLRKRGLY